MGWMVKIRNGMSSASLRKLYTVGDAITSFKTAVAPDVDRSSITLHFEPNRESISSDCLLAAIQLENSFEKPFQYQMHSTSELNQIQRL